MYWTNRLEEQEQQLYSKVVGKTERVARGIYIRAINATISEIGELYEEISVAGEPKMNDLYKYNRYFDLVNDLNVRLKELGGHEIEIYNTRFIELYHKVQGAITSTAPQNIAYTMVSPGSAEEMIKSVWCADGKHWSSRVWEDKAHLQKMIEKTMVDCVARGVSKDELIKEVKREFNVSFSNADRIIRTELNHVMNQSATDRYISAGVKYYEYIATDDGRTCDKCRELNGKIFPFTEAIVGVNMPPLHPNTRSTIKPVIDMEEQDVKNR